jgi:hypothetical protein
MLYAFLSYATHMLRLEIHAMHRFGVPFGLALVHYLSIQRVEDPGGLEQVSYTERGARVSRDPSDMTMPHNIEG